MYRSFSDRVLGGVCGGLATALHVNAWLIRLIFVLLTLVSLGAFAPLYVLLWWIVPAESPTQRRRGFPVIIALVLVILTAAALVLSVIRRRSARGSTSTGVHASLDEPVG